MLYRIAGCIVHGFADADRCQGFPSWAGWISREDQLALSAIIVHRQSTGTAGSGQSRVRGLAGPVGWLGK